MTAVVTVLSNADASALRLMIWREPKGLSLIAPIRRHIHQTRDAASRLALAAMFDWLDEAFR